MSKITFLNRSNDPTRSIIWLLVCNLTPLWVSFDTFSIFWLLWEDHFIPLKEHIWALPHGTYNYLLLIAIDDVGILIDNSNYISHHAHFCLMPQAWLLHVNKSWNYISHQSHWDNMWWEREAEITYACQPLQKNS